MNPFEQRILAQVNAHLSFTFFIAERRWGTPYILRELAKQEATCVWCDLTKEDEGNPVAIGSKLADALNRALEAQVVGRGMPHGYVVSLLRELIGLFTPLTLILSGAEYAQDLADDLAKLNGLEVRVVLEFEHTPDRFLIPEDALVVQADDLRLTREEAKDFVDDRLDEIETINLHHLTKGAYETFLLELHKRLGLPPKLRPHPEGAALPPSAEASVPPAVFLKVLERREQWIEALEVAAEHIPKRVPEFIADAGEAYLERGHYAKLFDLLEGLPEEIKTDESVLFWRLRAAYRLNRVAEVLGTVECYLATHEAPDLRALYASQLPDERSFVEVERAYRAAKTFTTLQHYGNAQTFRDPERGLNVFRKLVALAEATSHPMKRATAYMLFAFPLGFLSRYHESALWLEKALTTFDEAGLSDWQLRLHMLSNLAYNRILIGQTVGLRDVLGREVRALDADFPKRAVAFRSTLGDYYLSQGETEAALGYYLENLTLFEDQLATQNWNSPPYLLYNAVQGLLHVDKLEQAHTLMRKHYVFLVDAQGQVHTYAQLAYGMVSALTEPQQAIEPLEAACNDLEAASKGDHLVSACLYLAKAQLSLGNKEKAKAALARCKAGLKELSETGFRLLAGPPESFHDVRELWRGKEVPLKLTFLGQREVCLNNERLDLFPQWIDVLALLAQYPEGLSPEQLLLLLYGDKGKLSTLKGILSKLRRFVPITRPPYRLAIDFEADFLTLEAYLSKGHLRVGLELYRGPLLPKSDAPGVCEMRQTLDELLRQATLVSQDPDALLNLSERFEEDLELWEASVDALPKHDPRRAVAAAKQRRVLEAWQ